MKAWVALAGMLLMAGTAIAQGTSASAFPEASGNNLNGSSVSLPGDFAGRVNLVFITFAMRQQPDVDTWKTFAQDALKDRPWMHTYELPVMSRGYGIIRGLIEGGMRSGIPERSTRASTVTLYLDVGAFARALEIQSVRSIAVVLVKPSGEVLARAYGQYSIESAAPLVRALDSIK
jgi:hypothetical protein